MYVREQRFKDAFENVSFSADITWVTRPTPYQKSSLALYLTENHLQRTILRRDRRRPRTVRECIPGSRLAQIRDFDYHESREMSYAPGGGTSSSSSSSSSSSCSSFFSFSGGGGGGGCGGKNINSDGTMSNTDCVAVPNNDNNNSECWELPEVDSLFNWFLRIQPEDHCSRLQGATYESPLLSVWTFEDIALKHRIAENSIRSLWDINNSENKLFGHHYQEEFFVKNGEIVLDVHKSAAGNFYVCQRQNFENQLEFGTNRSSVQTDFEQIRNLTKSLRDQDDTLWNNDHDHNQQQPQPLSATTDNTTNNSNSNNACLSMDHISSVILYSEVLQGVSPNRRTLSQAVTHQAHHHHQHQAQPVAEVVQQPENAMNISSIISSNSSTRTSEVQTISSNVGGGILETSAHQGLTSMSVGVGSQTQNLYQHNNGNACKTSNTTSFVQQTQHPTTASYFSANLSTNNLTFRPFLDQQQQNLLRLNQVETLNARHFSASNRWKCTAAATSSSTIGQQQQAHPQFLYDGRPNHPFVPGFAPSFVPATTPRLYPPIFPAIQRWIPSTSFASTSTLQTHLFAATTSSWFAQNQIAQSVFEAHKCRLNNNNTNINSKSTSNNSSSNINNCEDSSYNLSEVKQIFERRDCWDASCYSTYEEENNNGTNFLELSNDGTNIISQDNSVGRDGLTTSCFENHSITATASEELSIQALEQYDMASADNLCQDLEKEAMEHYEHDPC